MEMPAAMRFITENNGKVDFKGYEKVQGLVALEDSTGIKLFTCSLHDGVLF